MTIPIRAAAFSLVLSTTLSAASAQHSVNWRTVDCGGGTSSGGTFVLSGTIGQADASPASTGGVFSLAGGFWAATPASCRPDFNGSGGLEIQDIFDYINAWLAGDPRTDFDGVGGVSVQDIFEFLNAWLAGCG